MAICAMRKLTAVALRSEADTLIRRLMWLSCVEVVPAEEDGIRNDTVSAFETECAEAEQKLKKLNSAIRLLRNYLPKDKNGGLFARKPGIERERYDADESSYSDEYAAALRSEEITYRLAELAAEKITLLGTAAALQPWKSCTIPLDTSKTRETRVWFGTLPSGTSAADAYAATQSRGAVPCAVEQISEDAGGIYVVVIYHVSCEDEVYTSLSGAGFTRFDMREYKGTAAENLARTENDIKRLENERETLEKELYALAENFDRLKIAHDAAAARFAVLSAKKKLYETRETVILTGWVPRKAENKVTEQLEKMSCCYGLSDPGEGDTVPVLLHNKEPASLFESVIALYSMPVYGSFDPTVIMSVFYFIIFGLMLGDVVYGLLLTAGGFLAAKLIDLDRGVKRLVLLFAVCGISCTISGILFGSYLGDLPVVFADRMLGIDIKPPALLFDPVSEPIMFLVVALGAGAVHLAAGMGVKFYLLWSSGKPFDAIFDVGSWYVLFIGIGVYAVNADAGKYIAAAGAAMLILTQGRAEKNIFMKLVKGVGSLYGIINYAADLLSYSRIMALGMASAVIASVINILATLPGPSVAGYLTMTAVVLVGHTVNLGINLLGTFVHTSRLQYIEFFGKFYEDGGKIFNPVYPEIKYTRVVK